MYKAQVISERPLLDSGSNVPYRIYRFASFPHSCLPHDPQAAFIRSHFLLFDVPTLSTRHTISTLVSFFAPSHIFLPFFLRYFPKPDSNDLTK